MVPELTGTIDRCSSKEEVSRSCCLNTHNSRCLMNQTKGEWQCITSEAALSLLVVFGSAGVIYLLMSVSVYRLSLVCAHMMKMKRISLSLSPTFFGQLNSSLHLIWVVTTMQLI